MLKNIGANWMLTLLSILSAYILMPYTIRVLGNVEYGLWILITSATGYLSLLVLGAPMTSVRFLSKSIAEKDYQKVNEYIGGFAGLYLMLGLLCLLAGAIIYAIFPLVFNIPEASEDSVSRAMIIVVFSVAASFIGQLPSAIFSAHQDFVLRNYVLASTIVLRFILTLALLTISPSIITVALVQAITIVIEFAVFWVVLHKTYPRISITVKRFEKSMLKEVLSFSVYVLILNLGLQLSYQTDALVIGAFQDPSQITFYTVANSITIYYMQFIIAIAAVVMPNATKLHTEGRLEELRGMFFKWSKLSLALTMAGGLFLLVFGGRFLGWWIGPEFEQASGTVLIILMLSFFILLPARGVAQPLIMGIGDPKKPTLFFLAMAVANLVISLVLVKPIGIVGVAIGTAVPNILYAIYLVHSSCQLLDISVLAYLRYVYLKAALTAIPVLLFLVWAEDRFHPQSIVELALAGLCSVALGGILWVLIVLRNDQYIHINFKRLLAR
jgi:O-antigen/teichoic acid export membrane protein